MRALCVRAALVAIALSSLLGCMGGPAAEEGAGSALDDRVQRMMRLCSTHHAIDPALLDQLSEDDVRVLRALARDRDRPLWLRSKAVSLVGVRPSDETRALWRDLRAAPERELRVQAAWAEGLSLPAAERTTFAATLLDDEEPALRETGAHLLAIAGGESARSLAQEHLRTEADVVVRAVLSRKLLSR